jgi:hypothetical protein
MSTWMGNFGAEVRTQNKIENNKTKIYETSLRLKTV